MATQAEINQLLGQWAANFLLLTTQKKFFNSGTNNSLNKWFKQYITPLYTGTVIANITLPTIPTSETCTRRDRGRGKALSRAYGNALTKQIRELQSQLPGILNTLSIANAGTIVAAFNTIRIVLDKDVGCGK
jgi:hypothetical protein